jgi:putative DNA primase/helicase
VVCFSSGNLSAIALALRGQYPTRKIVACADSDEAGIKAATKAGDAINAYTVFPDFIGLSDTDKAKAPNDFNDLHQLCGLEAVRDQISKLITYLTKRSSCQKK